MTDLAPLVKSLKSARDIHEKLRILDAYPPVRNFLNFPLLPPEAELVLKSLIAIGQERLMHVNDLVTSLLPVETFYAEIGGIVGYHWLTLELMKAKNQDKPAHYHRPQGIDISQDTLEVRKAIYWGIEHLDQMAEIYPVGGAADRLKLHDPQTGIPLPAARLQFCGRMLLEWMVADLQAREYLHYKLFGAQLTTPIAMMTSQEKNNHAQIIAICEEKNWFDRPRTSFAFFCQPLVPSLDQEGNWCLQASCKLLMKPGGHGVIWKLARDEGVIAWLQRRKALVRQINNPIASIDGGLLAFTGLGCVGDKVFGFASCPRQVNASEGINVLIEQDAAYTLTNIEYCDFAKNGIADEPEKEGSPYSKYPSNTNILFVDLNAIEQAIVHCPLPGMLVNPKHIDGRTVVRLETTMQNIADHFVEPQPQQRTFLTYSQRHKTISTVKKEYVEGTSLLETPEGCFADLMQNARELLSQHCHMHLPEHFVFLYHPALGPLFEIIGQKLRHGTITNGSELQLQIAEVDIVNLELQGSLLIQADQIMSRNGIYSENTGKCTLKNVTVRNQGYDPSSIFWKNEIVREQACQIMLHGNGELIAENVVLEGNMLIEVESGIRLTVTQADGKLQFLKEPIDQATWHWKYAVDKDYRIRLTHMKQGSF